MKKVLSIVLATVMAVGLVACGSSSGGSGSTTAAAAPAETKAAETKAEAATEAAAPETSDEVFELKFAGSMPVDSPSSQGMERIKAYCEEKSGGRLKITTYPANQLGDSTLVIEDIMNGNVDMGCFFNNTAYDKRIAINSLPYLVTSAEEAKKVYSPGSHYFETYAGIFDNLGVKILGIHGDGFVGMLFTKMPNGYNDVNAKKDLMTRMASNDAYRIALETLQYPSVTIAFSDLYTSLQTGVCDGAIGLTPVSAEASFAELIKYWVPMKIFIDPLDYMISTATWEKLPQDLRDIIQEAVTTETNRQFTDMEKLDQEALDKLVAGGTEILPLTDEELQAYADLCRDKAWAKMAELVGQDVIDEIKKDLE